MTRYRLSPVEGLDKGTMRRVEVAGHALCVARTDDGSFHAIDDRCTHEDADLSAGYLIGCEVECPLHGSRFDLITGDVCGLPADVPVTVHPVSVKDGEVYVDL